MIGIVTDVSVGGTFLSWTLHWLAGHDQVFSYEHDQWRDIPSNPINKTNAHGFSSNLMVGPDQFYKMLDTVKSIKSDQFQHVYFHPFRQPFKLKTSQGLDQLCLTADKILLLEHTGDNQEMYWCKYQARTFDPKNSNWSEYHTDWDEQHKDYVRARLLDNAIDQYSTQFSDYPWDYREFLALNWNQLVPPRISEFFNYNNPHYLINTYDMFNCLDQHIHQIFQYLNLKINPSRLNDWQPVYQEWRKIHHDRMQFQTYFNTIIQYIIHNKYMDLTRFDLDIVREAAIQHHLIKSHNLNLKNWQLTRFTDTQQLHSLLEKNTHLL